MSKNTLSIGNSGSLFVNNSNGNFTELYESSGLGFNVLNYDADPTGVADSTIAFQNAINAAKHGTVMIPSGTYKVGALNCIYGTHFLGFGGMIQGDGASILIVASGEVLFTSTCNSYVGISLANLHILGDDSAGQTAVSINGTAHSVIEKVKISHMGGYGIKLGGVNHTTNLTIRDSFIYGCGIAGIYGKGHSTYQVNAIRVDNCEVAGNGNGIDLWGANIIISKCIIEGNTGAGIFISGRDVVDTGWAGCLGLIIEDNYFEENVAGNILSEVYYISPGGIVTDQGITGLIVKNNYLKQSATGKTGSASIIFRYASDSDTVSSYIGTRVIGNQFSWNLDDFLPLIDAGGALNESTIIDTNSRGDTGEFSLAYLNFGAAPGYKMPNITGSINVPSSRILEHISITGIPETQFWPYMKLAQTAAINITANPQIAAGIEGQQMTIIGNSDINTLTLEDGNGLKLAGGASMVLGDLDVITLRYDSASSVWYEISRSDN